MTNQEEKATKLEEQVKALKEELEICQEAMSTSEACEALLDFANVKSAEPFSKAETISSLPAVPTGCVTTLAPVIP